MRLAIWAKRAIPGEKDKEAPPLMISISGRIFWFQDCVSLAYNVSKSPVRTDLDCFIHQTYGRMRVRVATLKGNLPFCRILMSDIAALPGVRHVSANDVTGSIVVRYDPRNLPSATILRVFKRHKLLHNVIGFPHAPGRPQQLARIYGVQSNDWVSETVSLASRVIIKSLVEAALKKSGQMILKKILP